MLKNSKIRLLIVISLVIAMVGSTTFASAAYVGSDKEIVTKYSSTVSY